MAATVVRNTAVKRIQGVCARATSCSLICNHVLLYSLFSFLSLLQDVREMMTNPSDQYAASPLEVRPP